jgi:hypothetical protein
VRTRGSSPRVRFGACTETVLRQVFFFFSSSRSGLPSLHTGQGQARFAVGYAEP